MGNSKAAAEEIIIVKIIVFVPLDIADIHGRAYNK